MPDVRTISLTISHLVSTVYDGQNKVWNQIPSFVQTDELSNFQMFGTTKILRHSAFRQGWPAHRLERLLPKNMRLRNSFAPIGILGALFLLPALGSAQVALVHMTTCGAGAFPAKTCAIPATGSGNLIVVGWSAAFGTMPTISTITDNVGNVYSEAGAARAVDSTATQMIDIWYAKNSIAGATTLTITPNPSGNQGGAVIWEFSNVDKTSPLDTTTVLNSQSATTAPSGASVAASSGELLISVIVPGGSLSGIYTGNAFTNDSTFYTVGWAHLIAPSAGTYAAQWSTSAATYASSTVSFKSATAGSAGSSSGCDLAPPYGVIDSADVNAAVNMTLGIVTPCTANIVGVGVCNAVVVQRVVNAMPAPNGTGTCLTGTSHSATLSWAASTSTGIAGYKVYRATNSGGPYTLLASPGLVTTFVDSTVQAGQTYYYVTTAVDSSGNESGYSNQAQTVVPTP